MNTQHACLNSLQAFASSLCLSQVVTESTHFCNSSCSLIDLVFLSCPLSRINCNTIPPLANFDHFGILVNIAINKPQQRHHRKSRKVWRYSQANFELACDMLESIDWNCIFSNDVNSTGQNWRAKFLSIMEQCIPYSYLKSKKNLPWLTKGVVQAIRERNMLFREAKRCKSTAAFQKYRAAQNKVVARIRLNKNKFFKKLGNSSQKEFWKAVKTMNNHESSISTLQHFY